MKKLLLLLFCMGLFSVASIAQSSNSERIKEIQTELDKAVEDGDFEKAAKLKKEREIRTEIEAAVVAGDFDKAAELKAKLKELENGAEQKKEQSTPPVNKPKEEKPKEVQKPVNPPKEKATPLEVNRVTKSGFYMGLFLGYGNYFGFNPFSGEYESASGPAFGIRLGNKFYFGSKEKDFRLGLDIRWGDITAELMTYTDLYSTSYYLIRQYSFINPGITAAKSFNNKLGLEAGFNVGPTIIDEDGDLIGFGLKYSPQLTFRYSVLSVGFEYSYSPAFTENMTTSTYGLLLGLKF